jgi:iron complex outermembrane receptor protein
MKSFNKAVFVFALGLGIILEAAPAAMAQEDDAFYLEEITVTAQKRSENQQKVAMAMQVLSAEDIQTKGKNSLDEMLADIPSVVINKANDGLRISLRGITDDTQTNHGQSVSMPTVALNVDGVFSNRKDTGTGLFDVERVEVLYGPQSTLYASNSPGGIVNVVTANPKLEKYEASGLLEYGNYDLLHTQGVMNAPIGSTVALRAAFSTSSHDGYLSNGGLDEDAKSARLRALYQPTEAFSVVVTGEIAKRTSQQFAAVDAFDDQDDLEDPWHTTRTLGDPTRNENKKIFGRIDWDLGFGALSLVPSYAKQTGAGQEISVMPGPPGTSDIVQTNAFSSDSEEKAVELRMASPAESSLKWVVGLNYYNSSDVMDTVGYVDGVVNGDTRWSDMSEEASAVFGNLTYPVTDSFRATVGFRQSWDTLENLRREATTNPGPDGAPSIDVQTQFFKNKYDNPDYKLGFEYDLTGESMVYADFSTSYRNQGMGIQQSVTPPPQELKAYTLGAKNRFFNNRLQVNAAAFYYDWENYSATELAFSFPAEALATVDPPTGDYIYVVQDDGSTTWGDGRMYGLEMDSTLIISPNDTLKLSVSLLESEWKRLYFDYENEYTLPASAGRFPQGTSVMVDLIPLEDASYDGKPMTSAPKVTLNATYRHMFNLPNGGSIEPEIQALYKSSYRLTWKDEDDPYHYQENFYTLNFSAVYTAPDGKWTLSGYVKNAGDYAAKVGYSGSPVNATMLQDPRTYGAVLSVRF